MASYSHSNLPFIIEYMSWKPSIQQTMSQYTDEPHVQLENVNTYFYKGIA